VSDEKWYTFYQTLLDSLIIVLDDIERQNHETVKFGYRNDG
jgi:hypothetical protein